MNTRCDEIYRTKQEIGLYEGVDGVFFFAWMDELHSTYLME